MGSRYEEQMKELETFYNAEEAKLRQELEEAGVMRSNLLDRIKTLESESGYAQAEVEKVVIRENCEFEYKQVGQLFDSTFKPFSLKFNVRSWNTRLNV